MATDSKATIIFKNKTELEKIANGLSTIIATHFIERKKGEGSTKIEVTCSSDLALNIKTYDSNNISIIFSYPGIFSTDSALNEMNDAIASVDDEELVELSCEIICRVIERLSNAYSDVDILKV